MCLSSVFNCIQFNRQFHTKGPSAMQNVINLFFKRITKLPFFITGIHSTNKGILCPFCSATRKKKLSLPKIICSVEVEGMWAYPTDVQRLLEDRGLSSEPRSSEVSPLVPRLCMKREHTYSENFGYIKLLWQPIPNDEIESDILR